MSNVLDLADQTLFLGERATGTTSLVQCIWVYDRPVDVDGLRRFHDRLGRGRLARRIERSPLPFGRHRWVSPGEQAGLEIVAAPRPREELDTWCGEQASTRPDAEYGPGWRLAVLPFTDGGSAVSLVITHCISDGVGLCEALADAASGRDDAVSWPAPAARRRWRAVREDARQTLSDTPDIGRAISAAVRLAREGRRKVGPGAAAVPTRSAARTAGPDESVTLPMATIFIDADEWDARSESLGGTGNALLAGLAARLAQRLGRVATDGSVNVGMPVNERTPGDTRANAVTNVDITVDPARATDLRAIRAAIRQALVRHQQVPDERWALLPLVPLIPKRLFRRLISVATGSATAVVSSNLGAIDSAANRPDGTDADYFAMKSLYPGVTRATMQRTNGVLALLSGRAHGRVFVSVLAYRPEQPNSNDGLKEHISNTLSDFALTATAGWRTFSPV